MNKRIHVKLDELYKEIEGFFVALTDYNITDCNLPSSEKAKAFDIYREKEQVIIKEGKAYTPEEFANLILSINDNPRVIEICNKIIAIEKERLELFRETIRYGLFGSLTVQEGNQWMIDFDNKE